MKNLDLLTIGDCSIDLFLKVPDKAINIENVSTGELAKVCFYHGSKIMVESFESSISGNSVNVAEGAQMLGLKTGIYTETGDDQNALQMEQEIKADGIDTTLFIKNANVKTAMHAVIVFTGERTIFSYHGKRDYKIKDWGKPKFIYYTSLGEGFETFQNELVSYIKQHPETALAMNPGTFQMAKGIKSLKNVLSVTDILFVNKEEALVLTELDAGTDAEKLHQKLFSYGVKLSVITDGEKGSSAFDGKKLLNQPIYTDDKPIKDKTGAGDAFAAAFLAAIFYGKKLEEALKWGAINSASQIKEIGSISGMIDLAQMQKIISKM